MGAQDRPLRAVLACTATEAVATLPGMGRVMTVLRAPGVTHERIGEVGSVGVEADALVIGGDAHDLRIGLGAVARVVADRSGRMRDRVLPRLEYQDGTGQVVFSAVVLSDLERFDAALAPLGEGAALPAAEKSADAPAPAEVAEDDPAQTLLTRLTGARVTVAMRGGEAVQRWTGVLEAPRAVMGHVNIIQPDFHLHLRAGAVSGWRETEDGFEALGADGAPLGLTVRPERA